MFDKAAYMSSYTKNNRERINARKRESYAHGRAGQYSAEYREANRVGMNAKAVAHYAANRESIKARKRAWREANKERLNVAAAAYRNKFRSVLTARNKAWVLANPERLKALRAGYRIKNRELNRASTEAYRKANHGAVLHSQAKGRAKKGKLPFSLTRAWVAKELAKGFCAVSGLAFERAKGRTHPLAPSLDRIVPAKGYVPDNCRIVAACINIGMRDWGLYVVAPIWQAAIHNMPAVSARP